MSHDPQQPADLSGNAREPYRLNPIVLRHQEESRRWIARAADAVAACRAIVLGAGACEEIPLAELVARFGLVTLNDVELAPLERAVARLDTQGREKIDLQVADLTGTAQPLLEKIGNALQTAADPGSASERMAEIVASQAAGGLLLAGKYDLVVASCVLSQLHVGLAHQAADLFAIRFPGKLEQLRGAECWTTALYRLARRIEARFIDDLIGLVADGGLIYLSESVQMCYVERTPSGPWQTKGTYRMLRSTDLSDYVDGRFSIAQRGRWEWVVSPPAEAGQTGRLYDVQALVLRVSRV